jgi:ketosteroid isomerase-like protein
VASHEGLIIMANMLDTVQTIYAAFGRGDAPTLLAALADDIAWEAWEVDNEAQRAGVPWLRPGRGKEAVLAFLGVAAQMKMHDLRVLGMMAGANQVAVEVAIDATMPTGHRVRDEELHLWTFGADGKVVRMRHYVDTAKHMRAALPSQP